MTNRVKKILAALFIGLCVFLPPAFSGEKQAEPDIKSLRTMTRDSRRAYPNENLAVALGVGRIKEDTAQGKLKARRAALLDARRNLLVLRLELLNGSRSAPPSFSGRVAACKIRGERIEGNLYFLEVEVPLDELLKADAAVRFLILQE